MSAPAAPPPRRRRAVCLPLSAALAAAAGLTWSLLPPAPGGGCPAAVVSWRAAWGVDALLDAAAAAGAQAALALTPAAAPAGARRVHAPTGLPLWRGTDLARFSGAQAGGRVVLGVCGRVYDVTALGARFYAPGRAYECFGGREATRAHRRSSNRATRRSSHVHHP